MTEPAKSVPPATETAQCRGGFTPLWLKVVFPLALLMVIVIGLWFYNVQKTDRRRIISKELETVARIKIAEISKWRESELTEGTKLTASPFFCAATANWLQNPQPEDTEKLRKKLGSLGGDCRYRDIIIVDQAGKARFSLANQPLETVRDDALSTMLPAALKTGRVSMTDLHADEAGSPCLEVIAPIISPGETNGVPVGAVVLRCNVLSYLYPLVQSWPMPSTSEESILVRREGHEVVLLNDTRFQTNLTVRYRFPLSRTNLPAAMAVVGITGVVNGVDYRDEPVLAYLSSIPNSTWHLVTKVDRKDAFRFWRSESALIMNLLLVCLVALCAIWLLLRQRNQKVHFHQLFRSERSLRASELRFKQIYEQSPTPYQSLDAGGMLRDVNPAWLTTFGYRRDEVIGRSFHIFLSPDCQKRFLKTFARFIKEGVVQGAELEIQTKSSGTKIISVDGVFAQDEDGRLTHTHCVLQDITNRQQMQEKLRESEERYRNLVETTTDWIWEIDAEGRYIYASPKVQDLLGYAPEEVVGQTPFDLMPESESQRVRALFQAIAAKKEPFTALTSINIHKEGRLVVLETSGTPMLDAQGRLLGYRGVDRNITERQQILEQLRESEERYRTVVNLMPVGIVLAIDDRVVFTNTEALRIVGATAPTEILGRSVYDFIPPEHREDSRERRVAVTQKKQTIPFLEMDLLRCNGTRILVEIMATPAKFQGRPAILNVLHDMSERRKAEAALRERDQLLVVMGRAAKIGGWSLDVATGQGNWTEEVARIHDLEPTSIPHKELGLSFYQVESRAKIKVAVEKCIAEGVPYDLELEILSAKGVHKWVRTIGFPVWQNDKVVKLQGSFQDISESKLAEQAMRKEEVFRRKIIDQAAEGMCVGHLTSESPHLRFTVWNSRMTAITGCTLEEINQKGWFETLFPDIAIRQQAIDRFWLLRQGQDLAGEEWEITRADGQKRIVTISTTQLDSVTPNEYDVDVLIFLTDITESKKAEAELLKLSHAIEQSPVSVVITDTKGTIEYVNPTFEKTTGYKPSEVIGRDSKFLKSGRTPPETYKELWQTITSGNVWQGEFCNRKKNGDLFWENLAISPVRDAAGRITNYLAVKEDITRRKQVEEILRQQAELLDAANDAIVVRTLDDVVKFWNTGAERLYGWSRAEAVGRRFSELNHSAIETGSQIPPELLIDGNWVGEISRRTKAERSLTTFCRLTLLRREFGRPLEILDISTDITEKKQLEINFLRAQRMEGIGALAGGIAHDLNNILAPILMSVPVLHEATTDPEVHQMIETVESCAKRGADIIRQLLTFARGKPGMRAPLPLRSLIAEMDKLIRETFPRNITVTFTAPKDIWMVMGDTTQIHQAIMNLCVNARDAMPDGGQLRLSAANVTLHEENLLDAPEAKPGDFVCVTVADTGMGISTENLPRIFDPFFTTKELGKGTGLGLATVLGIARGHEGFVRVQSRVGEGTTFGLFLPATQTAASKMPSRSQANMPKGVGELILVVDDEGGVRNMVQRVLERNGYRVLLATEGGAGLATYQAHQSQIKAIITDMMMPGMDGPTMVGQIRKINPDLPILGMTGLAERAGFKGIEDVALTVLLNKPFAMNDLLSALASALADARSD